MKGVGHAWAVVRGRRPGDKDEAQGLLDSMSPARRKEQNRQESQAQAKVYR